MTKLTAGLPSIILSQTKTPEGNIMTKLTSKRALPAAALLAAGIFLAGCTSYAANAQDTANAAAETGGMDHSKMDHSKMEMGEMDHSMMDMDKMSDEELRTHCTAMHEQMMAKMGDGKMMSGDHKHMEGMDHMQGMEMSAEKKAMHEKCMRVMPEMKEMHQKMHGGTEAGDSVPESSAHNHQH